MNKSGGKYPVKNGEIIELSISGMNHEGEGVGKYHGLTVFVPFALPEDQLTVQIEEVKKSYARGKVLEYLSFSDYRNESECSSYEECGGCQLQHYDYGRQLIFKREIVQNALERIAKQKGVNVLPVIGMKTPIMYRNKAEYPVRVIDRTLKAGFFASKSRVFVTLDGTCLIQHPLVEKTRETFMSICNQWDLKDRFLEASFHRLVIRVGVFSGEAMIVICSEKPVPGIETVCGRLISEMPQIKSVYQNTGKKESSNCLGQGLNLIMGKSSIREKIGSLEFDISPGSFFQVNSVQGEVLFSKTVEYAGCRGLAVDAYCGTGGISLNLAQEAEKVYGFEVYPDAVKDARHNAAVNEVENVEFIQGDAAVTLKDLHGIKPETIVIDPPRRGCDERVLQSIVGLQPEKIVYVSCNPATLARDLKVLADRDYAVAEVQPIDMFPQTYHTESVCLLERGESIDK